MAIYQLIEWQVKPGRVPEFVALEPAFQALVRKFGGKPVAGFTTVVGEPEERVIGLVAYDNFAALGRSFQAAEQDAEAQKLLQTAADLWTATKTSILNPTAGSTLK